MDRSHTSPLTLVRFNARLCSLGEAHADSTRFLKGAVAKLLRPIKLQAAAREPFSSRSALACAKAARRALLATAAALISDFLAACT